MFKELRVQIFNWFAAGRMTLTYEKPQEYKTMSNYVFNGVGQSGGITFTEPGRQIGPNFKNTIVIRVTPATGGHIVSVCDQNSAVSEELHIIPENTDFDRELGKIITMNRLKA